MGGLGFGLCALLFLHVMDGAFVFCTGRRRSERTWSILGYMSINVLYKVLVVVVADYFP